MDDAELDIVTKTLELLGSLGAESESLLVIVTNIVYDMQQ